MTRFLARVHAVLVDVWELTKEVYLAVSPLLIAVALFYVVYRVGLC